MSNPRNHVGSFRASPRISCTLWSDEIEAIFFTIIVISSRIWIGAITHEFTVARGSCEDSYTCLVFSHRFQVERWPGRVCLSRAGGGVSVDFETLCNQREQHVHGVIVFGGRKAGNWDFRLNRFIRKHHKLFHCPFSQKCGSNSRKNCSTTWIESTDQNSRNLSDLFWENFVWDFGGKHLPGMIHPLISWYMGDRIHQHPWYDTWSGSVGNTIPAKHTSHKPAVMREQDNETTTSHNLTQRKSRKTSLNKNEWKCTNPSSWMVCTPWAMIWSSTESQKPPPRLPFKNIMTALICSQRKPLPKHANIGNTDEAQGKISHQSNAHAHESGHKDNPFSRIPLHVGISGFHRHVLTRPHCSWSFLRRRTKLKLFTYSFVVQNEEFRWMFESTGSRLRQIRLDESEVLRILPQPHWILSGRSAQFRREENAPWSSWQNRSRSTDCPRGRPNTWSKLVVSVKLLKTKPHATSTTPGFIFVMSYCSHNFTLHCKKMPRIYRSDPEQEAPEPPLDLSRDIDELFSDSFLISWYAPTRKRFLILGLIKPEHKMKQVKSWHQFFLCLGTKGFLRTAWDFCSCKLCRSQDLRWIVLSQLAESSGSWGECSSTHCENNAQGFYFHEKVFQKLQCCLWKRKVVLFGSCCYEAVFISVDSLTLKLTQMTANWLEHFHCFTKYTRKFSNSKIVRSKQSLIFEKWSLRFEHIL